MAKWHAEALKCLPELHKEIAAADNVMALWGDLFFAFERAHKTDPFDESLIFRIYSFADWCMAAPGHADPAHDPISAVLVAFYEDIPTFRPARDDMPRWFCLAEIAENQEIFSRMIGENAFQELVAHMEKNQTRYRPRSKT